MSEDVTDWYVNIQPSQRTNQWVKTLLIEFSQYSIVRKNEVPTLISEYLPNYLTHAGHDKVATVATQQ